MSVTTKRLYAPPNKRPWRWVAVEGGWDGVCDGDGRTILKLTENNPSNAAHIVACVNSHDQLMAVLEKIQRWLTAQADKNDRDARACRFESLNEAYRADANNYRAIVKEITAALAAAKGTP